jgi:hypothetical protein
MMVHRAVQGDHGVAGLFEVELFHLPNGHQATQALTPNWTMSQKVPVRCGRIYNLHDLVQHISACYTSGCPSVED